MPWSPPSWATSRAWRAARCRWTWRARARGVGVRGGGWAAAPGVPPARHPGGLREGELNGALALAEATGAPAPGGDLPPAAVETVDLPSLREPAPAGLPRVGYIFAIRSQ